MLKLVAKVAIAVVGLCVAMGAAFAQAPSVDWRLYGSTSYRKRQVCFYDANGLTSAPDGRVKVWTKCLLKQDLDRVDIKRDFGGRILEDTAQKLVQGYSPPIASVEAGSVEDRMVATQYEVTADIAGLQPQSNIFYDLDCPQRRLRELSVYVRSGNKSGFSDKPSEWKYVPPEGNGARLLRLLCPAR